MLLSLGDQFHDRLARGQSHFHTRVVHNLYDSIGIGKALIADNYFLSEACSMCDCHAICPATVKITTSFFISISPLRMSILWRIFANYRLMFSPFLSVIFLHILHHCGCGFLRVLHGVNYGERSRDYVARSEHSGMRCHVVLINHQ